MLHCMVMNACLTSVKYHNNRDNVTNDVYFYILIEHIGILITLPYIHKLCTPKGAPTHILTPGTPFFFEKDTRYLRGL